MLYCHLLIHAEIERNCQVTITTNTRLPVALRLDQRSWIVATTVDLHFVILCGDRTRSKLVARAPLATVRMNSGCTAYSDFMVLVAQVNSGSSFGNVGPLQIRPINVSSPIVWSPITKKFPNFSVDAIPGKLREMEEIPIQKLLNALEQVEVERFRERPKGVSMMLIIGVSVAVVSIIIILGVVAKRWIARKREGKRPTGAQISLSLLNGAVGTASPQRPNAAESDGEMPSKGVYPDFETENGTLDKERGHSEQPGKVRLMGLF